MLLFKSNQSLMANDKSNVLALENILGTREIGDGPCFLYKKLSWIGVTLLPMQIEADLEYNII